MSDEPDPPWEWPEHGLVMPFVACQSQGGPYDDQAFVAGFRLGRLDAELPMLAALGYASISRMEYSADVEQIDLIAMRHGYRIRNVGEAHDGWVDIDLDRTDEDDQ